MTADDQRDGHGTGPGSPRDVDLSGRLERLEKRLAETRGAAPGGRADRTPQKADPSSMGKAFRLSTEFIAGIIAGAGMGWGLDQFAGTRPWGMIIFVLLGFGAGVWNVMRASGFVRPPGSPDAGGGS
nr:AtpZ/AtpI family protein [uncultured Alsobacter sp.]